MRVKLIALVVAGLFAQTAQADENFLWGGSIEVGGRGTNIDGANRNGAYGNTTPLSPTNPLTPFTGPVDGAKAQEYQDIDSAAIGVFDIRGGSKQYYLRAFGEELGRDDQFINIVGGGYQAWKAQVYNNNIPHNYSFNVLSPLSNPNGGLQQFGPGGTYPPAQNPSTWNTFQDGTQRNTWGGNVEFSNKTPWFIRADYNEVQTNGVKPGSAQLGTGSGNGLIELGVPVDYKTKNALIEGGYNSKQYGLKIAFIDSKFTNAIDAIQWTNFYQFNALDASLLPPDNELKKWSLNGYIKQLPWDSAIIARFTQSKQTSDVGLTSPLWTSSLKPTGNVASGQAQPPGYGYLLTQPFDVSTNQNLTNFNGEIKTNSANVTWNASPMAQLDTRVYYEYYDKQNNSTPVSYRAGSQGISCANPAVNSATCFTIPALVEEVGEGLFSYTKNMAGFDAKWSFDRANKLLGGYDWARIKREGYEINNQEAPKTDENRVWVEYRNTGWENLTGRLKYEYLQQRSDLINEGNPPTSVAAYYTPYNVNNFDRNTVRLNVDWTPMPMLLIGLGATWRDTDYKDNFYGRTKDKSQQYDATASWGDDKLRITGIGNWGKIEYNQAYLNGAYPPPSPNTSTIFTWGTQNTQDGWMAAALVDWAATDKLMLTASYTYGKTTGGLDFTSGNTAAAGGFNGGPLVNYVTDNTKLQRFQIKGTYDYSKKWAFNGGYAYEKYDYNDGQMAGYGSYYPYFQNLNTAAVGSNYSWFSGAFANPSYKTNLFWLTVTYKFDPPEQVYVAPTVAQAPAPAPVVTPPPPPPPPPAPPPQVQKVTLDAKALFGFGKADLTPEGKAAIDSQVIAKLPQVQKLEVVIVTGHTDRIGSEAFNQKLSEERAQAVGGYIASKGVDRAKIQMIGMGEKQPVVQCDQKNMKALIECLQPNRRVDVEVRGETMKR